MRAVAGDEVIAQSDEVIEAGGYVYFPLTSVRPGSLERTPKTAEDLECPHGVQFYDVIVGATRFHRAAWIYEAPLRGLAPVKDRVGFWHEVTVEP